MNLRRTVLACAGLLIAPLSMAQAPAFPSKPVTLVVPYTPGGVVDGTARMLSDVLAKALGTSVVIDNKPGASGNIGMQQVALAPKDGHTLLVAYSANYVANPAMFSKLTWAQKDFAPVALLSAATNAIAVHPSVPANNLQEFISYLKANPGKVNFASQGNGSLAHLGSVMFEQTTGTDMVHVPYKGSGAAIADVLGGQVQLFITTPPSVMQHVQAGKLKAFAITGKTRHPGMPNVPTVAEAGLQGFELEAWVALMAPAGTPAAVVNQLSEATRKALATPEAKTAADKLGIEIRYADPAGLAQVVAKDNTYWGGVIKTRKITAD